MRLYILRETSILPASAGFFQAMFDTFVAFHHQIQTRFIIVRHDSLASLIFTGAGEGKFLVSSDDLGILTRMLSPSILCSAPTSLPFLGV